MLQLMSNNASTDKDDELTMHAGGKPASLKDQLKPVKALFGYVTLEMMWAKPMRDWELVQDVIQPAFGMPCSLTCCLSEAQNQLTGQ